MRVRPLVCACFLATLCSQVVAQNNASRYIPQQPTFGGAQGSGVGSSDVLTNRGGVAGIFVGGLERLWEAPVEPLEGWLGRAQPLGVQVEESAPLLEQFPLSLTDGSRQQEGPLGTAQPMGVGCLEPQAQQALFMPNPDTLGLLLAEIQPAKLGCVKAVRQGADLQVEGVMTFTLGSNRVNFVIRDDRREGPLGEAQPRGPRAVLPEVPDGWYVALDAGGEPIGILEIGSRRADGLQDDWTGAVNAEGQGFAVIQDLSSRQAE